MAEAHLTPISFGGSGPLSANVRKTATMTAPAAKITRPESPMPPTMAALRSDGGRAWMIVLDAAVLA